MQKHISATIITLNEEKTIATCITNLKSVCTEILVLDSNSTDKTVTIAKKLGATVYLQPFLGDGPQKKKSAELAQNNWILSIDADETLDQNAILAIQTLTLDNPQIGYSFCRKNYLGEHWLKGVYPDRKIRLYNRTISNYSPKMIHSSVVSPKTKKLNADIIHPTFKSYTEWIQKLNKFSSEEAKYQFSNRKGKKITYSTLIAHSLVTFLKKFIFQGGIFKGKSGLISSIIISFHTFAKYVKMLEIQNTK